MVNIAQDTTVQIKRSWRFLNSAYLYINPKNTSVTLLLLILPEFGMIYLMVLVLAQRLPVSEKKLKSYLMKEVFPHLAD